METKIKDYIKETIKELHERVTDKDYMESQFWNSFPHLQQEFKKLLILVNGETPGAMFDVGEYVYDCKFNKGKPNNKIVRIGSRSFSEKREWMYLIDYISIDKDNWTISSGGSSCWWDEDNFKKIEDPMLLLIIKKKSLDDQMKKTELQLNSLKDEYQKINYAQAVIEGKQS